MASITSANVAQAIVKLVANQGLPALEGNLIMGSLVNRDFEPILGVAGDTVNIPIPPVMAANNISETGTVQTQNPSLGNAQVVLNTHAEASFTIPDVTAALVGAENGDMSLINKFLFPAIIAIAEKIETDLLLLYTNLTANTAVGATATAISEDTVDDAETALFTAKVPAGLPRSLVVSAQAYSDLRQSPRFSENRTNGDGSAIATGRLGTIKGFDVYRSQFVAKPSTTTYNLAFARDAFALCIRRLPQIPAGFGAVSSYGEKGGFGYRVIGSYSPNSLAMQFTVDCLYGTGLLRDVFGIVVQS